MSALALERLSAGYRGVPALAEVSVSVPPGEWLGVLGPNGSGKSTLLHCVARLMPYTGTVALAGVDAARKSRRELSREIAIVVQSPVVPTAMTVADYVLLGRTAHRSFLGAESRRDVEVAHAVTERLDLGGLSSRRLGTLSGGETQRAVLARALAQEPRVLLLDEPTSALDVGHQQQVLDLLDELRRERELTVLASMHDLTLAGQYADRVALLSEGHLIACGPPREVLTKDLIAEHYDASVAVVQGPDGRPVVVPWRRAGSGGPSTTPVRADERKR